MLWEYTEADALPFRVFTESCLFSKNQAKKLPFAAGTVGLLGLVGCDVVDRLVVVVFVVVVVLLVIVGDEAVVCDGLKATCGSRWPNCWGRGGGGGANTPGTWNWVVVSIAGAAISRMLKFRSLIVNVRYQLVVGSGALVVVVVGRWVVVVVVVVGRWLLVVDGVVLVGRCVVVAGGLGVLTSS